MKLTDIKDPKLKQRIHNAFTSQYSSVPGLSNTEQCEQPQALERSRERETQGSGCPLVRFTLYRVRLLDVDAKYASVKDLLDGLAIAGLIRGDKEGQVDLQVYQEKVSSWAKEQTVIEIIDI